MQLSGECPLDGAEPPEQTQTALHLEQQSLVRLQADERRKPLMRPGSQRMKHPGFGTGGSLQQFERIRKSHGGTDAEPRNDAQTLRPRIGGDDAELFVVNIDDRLRSLAGF